jgi:aminopeptidase N
MPNNLDKAVEHFKQVGPMMECFERFMGPYPFYRDGYALVETPYLGMEHQGAIAYGNDYQTGYYGMDYSQIGLDFDYIIIHETGHEWWGNMVSCADIADLWIHEGFCTYSEVIYVECLFGYETGLDYVNAKKSGVENKRPMIGDYGVNQEGEDLYDKGALLLNSLRHWVDDDETWWALIRGIGEQFGYRTVSSAELEAWIGEQLHAKAGIDQKAMAAFFDQYLRTIELPVLEYRVSGKGKKISVDYRWVAQSDGFNMAVWVSGTDAAPARIHPTTAWQTVEFRGIKPGQFKPDLRKSLMEVRRIPEQ